MFVVVVVLFFFIEGGDYYFREISMFACLYQEELLFVVETVVCWLSMAPHDENSTLLAHGICEALGGYLRVKVYLV